MNISSPNRFAAIADIHGNVDALAAVLEDIDRLGITTIVNLGDHLSGPLAARETADLIMSRDIICIQGNHDRWLVDQNVEDMAPADRTAFEQLDGHHLKWLNTLSATRVPFEDVFLCHGTPNSDETYWLESVCANGAVSLRAYEEIEEEALGLNYPLILCGHTHIPRAVRLSDNRLIVNPGSVGFPGYRDENPVPHIMQSGTPDATYAILEKQGSAWSATIRYVSYDTSRMVAMAERGGNTNLANTLATGWVHP